MIAGFAYSQTKPLAVNSRNGNIANITASISDKNIPLWADSLYLYWTAISYGYAKDFRKALDTMRAYVELHPFAVWSPGQTLSGINHTLGYTSQLPNLNTNDWIKNYNWLVKIYPANPASQYQATVIMTLADDLRQFDLNEAANMWYNYSLIYPDSGDAAVAWSNIKAIREYQKDIPLDTTPFHVLKFPLDTLALQGVKPPVAKTLLTSVDIGIVPNPAKLASEVTLDVTGRNVYDVRLYDALGKEVMKVYSGLLDEGKHNYTLSLKDITFGTYYLRVQYPGGVITRSLVVKR
jgi:hypothetical protein